MLIWFLFAMGTAVAQSSMNALSNQAVKLGQFSKFTVGFVGTATASAVLFTISYLLYGIPELHPGFWRAAATTGLLNIVMLPVGLKAFEYGEFSSVYSMSLTTPIFLLFTGWLFLGEVPPLLGMAGVLLTVIGLWSLSRNHQDAGAKDFRKGNLLALSVALMGSVSVNFDKLSVIYSNRFFSYAVISGMMAFAYGTYLLIRHRKLIVRTQNNSEQKVFGSVLLLQGIFLLFLIGIMQSLNGIFYNSALATGFAAYTIAVKRVGVLFGVIWGWLFFKEKNISKKLLGAGIAIAGVILILLS